MRAGQALTQTFGGLTESRRCRRPARTSRRGLQTFNREAFVREFDSRPAGSKIFSRNRAGRRQKHVTFDYRQKWRRQFYWVRFSRRDKGSLARRVKRAGAQESYGDHFDVNRLEALSHCGQIREQAAASSLLGWVSARMKRCSWTPSAASFWITPARIAVGPLAGAVAGRARAADVGARGFDHAQDQTAAPVAESDQVAARCFRLASAGTARAG